MNDYTGYAGKPNRLMKICLFCTYYDLDTQICNKTKIKTDTMFQCKHYNDFYGGINVERPAITRNIAILQANSRNRLTITKAALDIRAAIH